jgi:hypothetical protein
LGIQEGYDFVFGVRVVEPNGSFVGGIRRVVGEFGGVKVVPAEGGTLAEVERGLR